MDYSKFYQKYLENISIKDGEILALCVFHNDKKPSLSVNIETGKYHCFGCGARGNAFTFARLKNIKFSEVPGYIPGQNGKDSETGRVKSRIVKTYDYKDENGKLLFQVARYEPKDFKQRRPDGSGGWTWDLKGVRRVLYRLTEIIKSDRIIIVEGEKDCDNLAKIGICATTCPGGAGKWRLEYNQFIKNKEVVLIPDNDQVGKNHMQNVSDNLKQIAQSIRTIDLPECLGEKGDVSNFLEMFGKKEFENFINSPLPEVERLYYDLKKKDINELNLTDLGNAETIVLLFSDRLRYDNQMGKWLIYHKHYWKVDREGEIKKFASLAMRKRLQHSSRIQDQEKRGKLARWALRSESRQSINSMIELAQFQKPISALTNDFDKDDFLLGCQNGVINLKTGKLLQGRPEMMISKSANVSFNSSAKCDRWLKFLNEIFANDSEMVEAAQRYVGYSLTGNTNEQVMFILYGSGSNGKSTFLDVILKVMGDYGANTPFTTFESTQFDGSKIPNDIAKLSGKRFVWSSEIKDRAKINEGRIKALTGGDPITARFLHKEYFTFTAGFKIWFSVNHKPVVNDNSFAFWRRIRLIPFEMKFEGENKDENLKDKLFSEIPGILKWAIAGCLNWQKFGLPFPEKIESATKEYQAESDTISQFLDDCTIRIEGQSVEAGILYESYKNWANKNNEHALTANRFGRKMSEFGLQKGKDGETRRFMYLNLAILDKERLTETISETIY